MLQARIPKDLITETGIGFHVSSLNDTKEALLKFYNEFNENNIITFKANESIDTNEEYSF